MRDRSAITAVFTVLCICLVWSLGFWAAYTWPSSGGNDIQQMSISSYDPCDRACAHDQADLIVQQSMAAASWWMVGVTVVGAAVGLVSLWFIWRTVTYTRDAARSAGASVAEARAATAAANLTLKESREANRIAQEAIWAEHRPWLRIEAERAGPLSFTGRESVSVNFDLRVINESKYPAVMVRVEARAYWTYARWPSTPELEELINETKNRDIRPDRPHAIWPSGKLPYGFVQLAARKTSDDDPDGNVHSYRHDYPSILVVACVVYKSTISETWLHTAQIFSVRRKIAEGVDPRDRRHLSFEDGEVGGEELEAADTHVVGGSMSIA